MKALTIPGTLSQNYAPIPHKLREPFCSFASPNYSSEECPKCIKLKIDGLARKLKMGKSPRGVKNPGFVLGKTEEGESGV